MRKTLLTLLGCLMLLTAQVFAQDRAVTGKVSAEDGSALPGVNISLKGTNRGTTTNAQGEFSINAESNSTLVFSFIGFQTQEAAVGSQTTINVSLKNDVSQLQEVVVTALGQERKRNELVYAAQQVNAEQITQARNPSVMNALAGKVAGLDIKTNNNMGGSTSAVIRGFKSITGNNQALWVIDGVPVSNANTNTSDQQTGRAGTDYGNAAADINPDNIASVNVLKGAAATALYGSRASNGVILITTKQGRKNSFDVVVNSGVTWGKIDKTTFVKYQKEYGAGYDGDRAKTRFYRGNLGSGEGNITLFDADASFGPKFDPSVMVYQWDALDPSSPNYQKMTPWVAAANGPDAFYETGVNSNQSVSITGGGDNTTFKVGYTRNDEKGVLPNSKLGKNLFNFSASFDLTKKLTVQANANYSQIKGLGRYGTGYDGKNPNQQFRQWFQTNVDLLEQKDAYFRNEQNVTWNWASPTRPFDTNGPIYSENPYYSRYQNYSNDTRDNFFGYAQAIYKLAPWVDITGRFAYNGTQDFQEERIAFNSSSPAEYSRYNRGFNETNLDVIVNFRKAITKDINFSGLAGGSMRRSKLNALRAKTNGGMVVPGLYSLLNSINAIEAPSETYQRIGVDGIYAQASFGYKDLVNLDLTARQDKSSTLPKDNNTYFYPAVGANFNFSNLPGFKFDWLTMGKLSANYAEVGNDAPWGSVLDVYDKPTGIGSTPYFTLRNTKNNPNLKSERTKSYEFGLETAFLNDRVGFNFTYYRSQTLDQVLPVSVSSATGFAFKYINSGEVQNKGIEISAYVTPVKTPDFSWTVSANFARNRNEVVSLYEGVENVPVASLQGGVSLNAAVGQPFGIIRGTNFVYHKDNGQKVVRSNGTYQATASSAEIIGNPNPDWIGGLSNNLKFKSLSLSFLLDIRHGGDVWSLDQWYGEGTGLYPNTAGLNELGNPKRDPAYNYDAKGNKLGLTDKPGGVLFPGVKADGTPNDIRAENSDGNGNTAYGYPTNPPRAMYIYDASYIKLREVALTYSIPQEFVSKLRAFKGIDVSVIGRNLWIISKNMDYQDPEEGLGSGLLNGAGGYQSGAYPAVRSYGFNVKFRF
ncbi:SusC/RagA family TonB-linked outer membrane protein [Dyadobacter sp. CY327]|uniref:SusC/RagA family TonB-linked outer membrane protein n=2 Tax=unclassified Dyadobacter TaxID=2625061 RepID=UPI001F34D86C|nr:SusC/RagA family TonB-linked outer membrane protein [Dyadobacter sp. CY327]MCE7071367.1 SusC/RagA family TonB-linked outer membrane protein [Dyadobacter sp. CY327]